MAKIAVVFIAVVCMAVVAEAWKVTLFRDTSGRGGRIDLSGSGCVNIGKDFNDKASSANTHGGCVRLYQNGGCLGEHRELFPGSASHNNLGKLGFNDRTSAVGPCPPRGKRSIGPAEDEETMRPVLPSKMIPYVEN